MKTINLREYYHSSYFMLLELRGQSREFSEGIIEKSQAFTLQSQILHKTAISLARSNEYQSAVDRMSDASRLLVRALQYFGLAIQY